MTILSLAESIPQVLQLFRTANNIVITTHVNPDGDAIGSTLALHHLLRSMGKSSVIVNCSPTPSNLRFLPGAEHIQEYSEALQPLLHGSDLIVVCDLNAPSRLENMAEATLSASTRKVVIDHHQEPQNFADMYAVDTEASSTCEIVWRLAQASGAALTAEFAACCYTGIMTDTGNFRFPRTDAELHRIVADLIDLGANPVEIYEKTMNSSDFSRSRLLGESLASMELFHGGKLCVMMVSDEMLRRHHCSIEDIEGFVQSSLSIGGVSMGILLVEVAEKSMIKCSIRSKGDVSARGLAALFGGGGHFNAAAARRKNESLADVKRSIVTAAADFL